MRSLLSILFATALVATSFAEGAETSPSAKIDQLINQKLKEEGLKPNKIADDSVFVRRVYLDLVGRIPTRVETTDFIESEDPEKRADIVGKLIGSEGYVSHQFNYWADLLRARTAISDSGQSRPSGMAYEQWLKESIRSNKPYNELVYELVTASGNSWENPAIGYYLRDYGMPLDNLAMTSQLFLGTQIVCAQCHNHPFDAWTQMDYYHLSAFTYGMVTSNNHPVARQALQKYQEKKKLSKERTSDLRKAASEILIPVRFSSVYETDRSLRLPHDYQYDDAKPKAVVKPATLMGNEAVISGSTSTIEAFGEWLTSPENPAFTKVMANRIWKRAFGVGVFEPVDDLKDHTQSSNPELMDYLTRLFIDLDYDIQAFQKVIYSTKAYQRESALEEPVPGAPYYFAGPILRRLSAEQIWDSLVALTVENPDERNLGRELFAKRSIAEVQLVAESIETQNSNQFMRNILEISKVQKELSTEIEAALAKVTEARLEGDPDKIREASTAARKIRQRLRYLIEEKVFREGLEERLADLKPKIEVAASGEQSEAFLNDLAAAVLKDHATAAEGMDAIIGQESGAGVIDQLVAAMFEDEQKALNEQRKKIEAREEIDWNVKSKEDKRAFKLFSKTILRRMQRASDLSSPTTPGHFLREFGQSDRELIENSSDQASVTQALALLNGPVIGGITNKYSVLSRDIGSSKSFPERLDTIYLSMLSRLPTPHERGIFREAWEADPESGTVKGIIWTLLNTRQFLFVQ